MIKYDDGNNRKLIFEMWQRNFHDPADYAQFYFDEVYGKNQVTLYEKEETCCGMIHHNPYTLMIHGKEIPAHYIVGVATDEEYRRQGIMRELLKESFSYLRKQGEIVTYLMPADERYYLPFGFRFGMNRIEQEIDYQNVNIAVDEAYEFLNVSELEESLLHIVSETDNCRRNQLYQIHTKIDAAYLKRMHLEAKSDYSRMICVFSKNQYVGRCVIGAEDNYMTLSQISLAEGVDGSHFLSQIMTYCENRYHFGYYRIVAEEAWTSVIDSMKERFGFRMMSKAMKPTIMFRILSLEDMACMIPVQEDAQIKLYIKDEDLPEQDGVYNFVAQEGRLKACKLDHNEAFDGGSIDIADFTQIIFQGYEKVPEEKYHGLTEKGKEFLRKIQPIQPVCITEIV